jgi:hypothetical protein
MNYELMMDPDHFFISYAVEDAPLARWQNDFAVFPVFHNLSGHP